MTEQNYAQRLKQERSRIGMTLQQLADACGVSRRSQGAYESGQSAPDLNYLHKASNHGVDINYVIMGARRPELDNALLELVLNSVDAWESGAREKITQPERAKLICASYNAAWAAQSDRRC